MLLAIVTLVLAVKVPTLQAADADPAQNQVTAEAPPAAGAADAPKTDTVADDEITVIVSGVPISGHPVLPADDKDFKLKLSDTGQIVTLHWDDLVSRGDDAEKRRVQKLYGLEMHNGHKGWVGEQKLQGVRLHLASGKTLDALSLPDRDLPVQGLMAFKTSGCPLMLIHEYDVKSKEPIECFESDFFTAREIYDRWLLEKPPASNDAAAFLELARNCANMELYREALDNLKKAEIIDPRTEERNKDMRQQIIKQDADKQTQELYNKMLQRCLARDYFAAADYLEKLERNFPNSEYKSRWDVKKKEIELGTQTERKKEVIFRAYQVALDLIQNEVFKKIKIDKKGNIVPSIPGKQITTKNGDIFRGTLSAPDPSGAFAMKVGDMELTIAKKDIMAITDIDLSEGAAEVRPTYDDMKDFVTDLKRPDGLKAQMITKIAKALKVTEKEVLEIFDGRLSRKAHYEDGQLQRDERYVSIHDAKYGKGSWLRDGSKPLPLYPDGGGPNQPKQQTGQRNGQNGGNGQQQQPAPPEDPEVSDDPNVWWANQTTETQMGILKAMAAEKVFKAKQVIDERCPDCGGKGTISVPGPGGKPITYRCPRCRGVQVLFSIVYE
jgi:tetratricopeptide (TPR) repeat protein